MEELHRAGIEYEIIPGVTSAFGAAAAAGIPLTHREQASNLVILTGRVAPGKEEADWRPFVSSGATLVVYMPGQDHSHIAARLRNAGMRGETPCAIVSRATTPDQQIALTTVADLPRSARLHAPTLLVVGEVVRAASRKATPESIDLWRITGNAENRPQIPGLGPVFTQVSQLAREEEPTA